MRDGRWRRRKKDYASPIMMNDSATFRKLSIPSHALIEGDDCMEVNPLPGKEGGCVVYGGRLCTLSHLSPLALHTCRRKGARWHKAPLLSYAPEVENEENCLLISTAAQKAKTFSHAVSSLPPARGISSSEQKNNPRQQTTKQPYQEAQRESSSMCPSFEGVFSGQGQRNGDTTAIDNSSGEFCELLSK